MGEYLSINSWSVDWFCCVLYTPFAFWWKYVKVKVYIKKMGGPQWLATWWIPQSRTWNQRQTKQLPSIPHLSNVHLCFWNLWIGVVEPTHLAGCVATAEALRLYASAEFQCRQLSTDRRRKGLNGRCQNVFHPQLSANIGFHLQSCKICEVEVKIESVVQWVSRLLWISTGTCCILLQSMFINFSIFQICQLHQEWFSIIQKLNSTLHTIQPLGCHILLQPRRNHVWRQNPWPA